MGARRLSCAVRVTVADAPQPPPSVFAVGCVATAVLVLARAAAAHSPLCRPGGGGPARFPGTSETRISLGDYSKAIEYQTQCLAIAKEVGDRSGEGGAYGNLKIAYRTLGTLSKQSSATRRT